MYLYVSLKVSLLLVVLRCINVKGGKNTFKPVSVLRNSKTKTSCSVIGKWFLERLSAICTALLNTFDFAVFLWKESASFWCINLFPQGSLLAITYCDYPTQEFLISGGNKPLISSNVLCTQWRSLNLCSGAVFVFRCFFCFFCSISHSR